ncbi:MAG: type II toxin-antitoxin system prevent-host-death family antitoxin [Deltaproteobacteria bacterium]|nr:type II toxin-antitoxin system prevent-host-death family antitoxin [Deltaproteobacteria bacterium]
METVGIRELKSHLSLYLKRVKAGEKIVVTDRKKEVAIIMPSAISPNEEHILKLARRGIVSWAGGKPVGASPRVVSKGKCVSDAVIEDRR